MTLFILSTVFTSSRCAPGRLGTIDQYYHFEFPESNDQSSSDEYETTTFEWEAEPNESTICDDYDVLPPLQLFLKEIKYLIKLPTEQDAVKGRYKYKDEAGPAITVFYIVGLSDFLSSLFSDHHATRELEESIK